LLTKEGKKEEPRIVAPELFTLVLPADWDRMFDKTVLHTLKQRLLPAFLIERFWYQDPRAGLPTIDIVDVLDIGGEFRLLVIEAKPANAPPKIYIMGLGISWDDGADDPFTRFYKDAICKTRRFNRVGVMYEATREENFIRHMMAGFVLPQEREGGKLLYQSLRPMPELLSMPIKPLDAEQPDNSAIIGDKFIVKLIAQPQEGTTLEEDINRPPAETAKPTPPLAGVLRLIRGDVTYTIALVEEAIANEGKDW
jgi:hypothetical protein